MLMLFIVYKKIRLGTDYLYYLIYGKFLDLDWFFLLLFVLGNHMIFLVQFGINFSFWKTYSSKLIPNFKKMYDYL